jgi:hypothetical protein
MANLICFPHYTCGGLLCDILNNKFSSLGDRGDIRSFEHSLGKIGDTGTVQTEYDISIFLEKIKGFESLDVWIGTHAWPATEIVGYFDKIVIVTTTTFRSKIYRWSRVYHHFFKPQWQTLSGVDLIDKARETAKNYLGSFNPVWAPNVANLEFADVVDNTQEFQCVIQGHDTLSSLNRWRSTNNFLYADDFWNRFETKIFYQAEFEQQQQRYYIYNFR